MRAWVIDVNLMVCCFEEGRGGGDERRRRALGGGVYGDDLESTDAQVSGELLDDTNREEKELNT